MLGNLNEPPPQLPSDVDAPSELSSLILAAMAKEPAERPASCDEYQAAVNMAVRGRRSDPAERPPGPGGDETRLVLLPTEPSSLVGRDQELAALMGLVRSGQYRLITLTGPGGAGKTRLAVRLAHAVSSEFDVVVFVGLAPLVEGSEIPAAIGRSLSLAGAADVASLAEGLAERAALVVVDNAEHLPEAGELIGELVAQAGRLSVVVTSRQPLGVPGEQLYPLEPLAHDAAAKLFCDRVAAVRPGLQPDQHEWRMIGDIVERVGGLPLAVELAAARMRVLPLAGIVEALDHQLDLLATTRRASVERHRTIRATLDWSYRLLDDEDRRLLCLVSIFPGGATVQALSAVSKRPSFEVIDGLERLVEASLAVLGERAGEPRYDLLEPIRQYARSRLSRADELALGRRQLRFYVEVAEAAEESGGDTATLLRRERANVAAAMRFAQAEQDLRLGIRLARASIRLWLESGERRSDWIAHAIAGHPELDATTRGLGLVVLGAEHATDDPIATLSEAIACLNKTGDPALLAEALLWRADALNRKGHDLRAAVQDLSEAGSLVASTHPLAPWIAHNLALGRFTLALSEGTSRTLFDEALAEARRRDDVSMIAIMLGDAGWCSFVRGDDEAAIRQGEEAPRSAAEWGWKPWMLMWAIQSRWQSCARADRAERSRGFHQRLPRRHAWGRD
jgi:predicted ATPase